MRLKTDSSSSETRELRRFLKTERERVFRVKSYKQTDGHVQESPLTDRETEDRQRQ